MHKIYFTMFFLIFSACKEYKTYQIIDVSSKKPLWLQKGEKYSIEDELLMFRGCDTSFQDENLFCVILLKYDQILIRVKDNFTIKKTSWKVIEYDKTGRLCIQRTD